MELDATFIRPAYTADNNTGNLKTSINFLNQMGNQLMLRANSGNIVLYSWHYTNITSEHDFVQPASY